MWHSLFSVFIDVTCYRGLTAPPDEIAKLINALSPSEITRGNLSRIYIYNMNSIYRKRLRRLLRVVVRNATNIFHPNNVDYHLIGSPQELQVHFNLSSLLLPKETSKVQQSRLV
jgi:neurofibromin 1